MNIHVEKTGSSFTYSVVNGEYNLSGNIDKRPESVSINGNIDYATSNVACVHEYTSGNLGNYSYNSNIHGDNNFNYNYRDVDNETEVIAAILETITSLKAEVEEETEA